MYEKIHIIVLSTVAAIAIMFAGIQTFRLGRYREQYFNYREQCQQAQNRESEIRDIIGTTNTLLSETADTTEQLRRNVGIVKEAFNYMEVLLYNGNNDWRNNDYIIDSREMNNEANSN